MGLKHGLSILEKTSGDIVQAEALFQEELLMLVRNKTGVAREVAVHHLIKHNFNISAALRSIDEEGHSATERILSQYQYNKDEALTRIAATVEEHEKLSRQFWLDFTQLQKLKPEAACLVTIVEWLNFESWEGFDVAVCFHLDVVVAQIETQLLLPQVAATLKKAAAIHQLQTVGVQNQKGEVEPATEFARQNSLFEQQRSLLIQTLYDFVKAHIVQFP